MPNPIVAVTAPRLATVIFWVRPFPGLRQYDLRMIFKKFISDPGQFLFVFAL